jgi:hypothetical protein
MSWDQQIKTQKYRLPPIKVVNGWAVSSHWEDSMTTDFFEDHEEAVRFFFHSRLAKTRPTQPRYVEIFQTQLLRDR